MLDFVLLAALLETVAVPSVVSAVAPEYPNIALQARVSGVIPVEVEIGLDGVPVSARAKLDGPSLLSGAAEATALRWRFAPSDASQRDATHVTLRFSFLVRSDWVCNQPAEQAVTFKPPFEVELAVRPYVCCLPARVTTKKKPAKPRGTDPEP